MTKPRIPITDKRFQYTDSAHTDIRKTIEKAKREIAEQRGEKRQVIPMRNRT